MDKLIIYILKRIEEGAAVEDLATELKLIQRLMQHIPSYHQDDALNGLIGGDDNAE